MGRIKKFEEFINENFKNKEIEANEKYQDELNKGKNLNQIFDEVDEINGIDNAFRVYSIFLKKFTIVVDNNLIGKWYNQINTFFSDGFLLVKGENTTTYLDTDFKEIPQRFDDGGPFYDGYASVTLHRKDYALDTNGNLCNPNVIEHK